MIPETDRQAAGSVGAEAGPSSPPGGVSTPSKPPASWKRVFLPTLLVPLSWVLIAWLNPQGFAAEFFYLYLLIALVSFLSLAIRLLVSLFRWRWDRLVLRSLLVIGWVIVGMVVLREGVDAINADMETLAHTLQQQCRDKGLCPPWPIELPGNCQLTHDQHFFCVRNHISFRCHFSLSNDRREFHLFDGYGIFLGNIWSGGVELELEHSPWD